LHEENSEPKEEEKEKTSIKTGYSKAYRLTL